MSAADHDAKGAGVLGRTSPLGLPSAHEAGYALFSFARYMDRQHLKGPLTVERMSRLGAPRQVAARHARDLGATTEAAAAVYPLVAPVRAAYRSARRDGLRAGAGASSAARLPRGRDRRATGGRATDFTPQGGLRPATYETLFGLIAAAGLRVSEALALRERDVDLAAGTLTVRQTKFAKSRQLPLHPSTVDALARYRRLRRRSVPASAETTFFVGTPRPAARPRVGPAPSTSCLH